MGAIVGIIVALLAVGGIAFLLALRSLIEISGPNEVLVFSGRTHQSADGERGYRLIRGGRGLRVPLIEKVERLDLTNMNIEVRVFGAYSKGGIPLNVQAVANVKVAGDEPIIDNAIERVLPKSRDQIMRIAKETLEGNLRGVLATLTPEEVNEDKKKFAESLTVEAGEDLSQLGLVLDSLKIQNVTDDQGYLAAIGRKQSADLERRARIAEAEAKAEATVTEARNHEQTRLRQIKAELEVARAEAERRIVDAETMRAAVMREEEGEVEALIASAQAELDVQRARIEETQQRLQAELIEPWLARRDAMVNEAQGKAAQIVEDGRARADSLREVAYVWSDLGEDAKRVLLLQKLERIVEILVDTVPELEVEDLTVIDGVNGGGDGTPLRAVSFLEQLKKTTGIDLSNLTPGQQSEGETVRKRSEETVQSDGNN
jgi:flotillin